ncbi:hypothetical protein BDR26DRAFT_911873, partial [Obelidium mucronatum]
MYKVTGTGAFQCHFMWGKDALPLSDPHLKKKDAKAQAAHLALAKVSSMTKAAFAPTPTPTATPTLDQPADSTEMQIDSANLSEPSESPVTSSALDVEMSPIDRDPIRTLHILATTQYSTAPVYSEISAHGGFQYSVALDGRVIATSDVFLSKNIAKQDAANAAIERLGQEMKDPSKKKRKRIVNSNSTTDLTLHQFGGPNEKESLWDLWETEISGLVADDGVAVGALGVTKDMKKCTNNIVASICLALQSNTELNVDRVVVGGTFGRGTTLPFDYAVEISLFRNRNIDAFDGSSSWADPHFFALVNSALKSSSISSSIYSIIKDGEGVKVWYNGIQSLRLKISDGVNLVDQKEINGPLPISARWKQLAQQATVLAKLREKLSSISDSTSAEDEKSALAQ